MSVLVSLHRPSRSLKPMYLPACTRRLSAARSLNLRCQSRKVRKGRVKFLNSEYSYSYFMIERVAIATRGLSLLACVRNSLSPSPEGWDSLSRTALTSDSLNSSVFLSIFCPLLLPVTGLTLLPLTKTGAIESVLSVQCQVTVCASRQCVPLFLTCLLIP